MTEDDLEYVEGLTKHHEKMWIERAKDGSIKQVYDIDLNPIETYMLYRSFIVSFDSNGITYKGEFIPMKNSLEIYRKRALGNQRRRSRHNVTSML